MGMWVILLGDRHFPIDSIRHFSGFRGGLLQWMN